MSYENFLKFNSAHDVIDYGELVHRHWFVSMVVGTPGLNEIEDKVEVIFMRSCVSITFDSVCSIERSPFK